MRRGQGRPHGRPCRDQDSSGLIGFGETAVSAEADRVPVDADACVMLCLAEAQDFRRLCAGQVRPDVFHVIQMPAYLNAPGRVRLRLRDGSAGSRITIEMFRDFNVKRG